MKCDLVDARKVPITLSVQFSDLSPGEAVIEEGGTTRLKVNDTAYLYREASGNSYDVNSLNKWPEDGIHGEVVKIKLIMEIQA